MPIGRVKDGRMSIRYTYPSRQDVLMSSMCKVLLRGGLLLLLCCYYLKVQVDRKKRSCSAICLDVDNVAALFWHLSLPTASKKCPQHIITIYDCYSRFFTLDIINRHPDHHNLRPTEILFKFSSLMVTRFYSILVSMSFSFCFV